MPSPKQIKPGETVGLKLTAAQRKLILNDLLCLDDDYAEVIRTTPADQAVKLTLDDWEDFGGYIAAEANHTEDSKLRKTLDTIFAKIEKLLNTYTDEESSRTLKSEGLSTRGHRRRLRVRRVSGGDS